MQLRDYQVEGEEALFSFFRNNPDPEKNPVIAMPTGTGKAVSIGSFTKRVIQTWPNQRIMMLTHVKELIEQNAAKLRTMWPQVPMGIYSAGIGEKIYSMPVTYAGIQSVQKKPQLFGKQDLILIDECHLVSPEENAGYKKFINGLREKNPRLRVVGYSATPYRLGLGMITDGGLFTDMAYDITGLNAFVRLLDEGYLSPLIPKNTSTKLDISGVHKRGGEFIPSELMDAVVREDITREALRETMDSAWNRNHIMIFASGIEHVEMTARLLREMGQQSVVVHSKLTASERDFNIAQFLSGRVRFLINSDVLTTGFDFPALDCIVLLRPTNSPGLHVQILGRGTRPFYMSGFDLGTKEGRIRAIMAGPKQNCLVLDFAGNTQRLGPINDPRIPKRKGEGTGDIPIKVCKHCDTLNHISARVCAGCGAEFVFEEKITTTASTVELIVRDEPIVELFTVDRVTFAKHEKMGQVPSLKVSYFCGVRRFTEWVCLQHEGNSIQKKAQDWWRKRSDVEPPATIDEAFAHVNNLRAPKKLRVWVNKKYPDILAHLFEEDIPNDTGSTA